ncbi:MAG: DUF4238 domain-containing protein [Vulcanimicrobiota bacterium]
MGVKPVKQHFVPKFLLDHFLSPGTDQLFAFDKETGNEFTVNKRDAASQRYFYDYIDDDGGLASAEAYFHQWEEPTADLLRRILRQGCISYLNEADSTLLAVFLCVQQMRTPALRRQLKEAHRLAVARFREKNPQATDQQQIDGLGVEPDENELVKQSLEALKSRSAKAVQYFLKGKVWMLHEAIGSRPFIIGDNPIGFQLEHGPAMESGQGTLSIETTGIEMYMPLSSRYTISVVCTSHFAQMKRQRVKLLNIVKIGKRCKGYTPPREIAHLAPMMKGIEDEAVADLKDIEAMIHSIRTGASLPSFEDHVVRKNSIQVYSAERFLYSSTSDFSLAKQMVACDSHLKGGLVVGESGLLPPTFPGAHGQAKASGDK